MSQRQYAKIINLTTERSSIASRILELALNRSGKSVTQQPATKSPIEAVNPVVTTPYSENMMQKISETQDNINLMNSIIKQNEQGNARKKLSESEIERTKKILQKDVQQNNRDIQLLSLLLGKQVNSQDIESLISNVPGNMGKSNVRSVSEFSSLPTTLTTQKSTIKTTSRTVPAFKPLSDQETKLLKALQQMETTQTITSKMTTERTVKKSQEAVIAALLKQEGFGPNNQVPIEVSL